MRLIRHLIIPLVLLLLSALPAGAASVRVLIMDDVFQGVPGKDEQLESMGKMTGDLLVNGSHYQGNIEVWKGASGLFLINELPLEDYVKSVVSAEVGQNWDMEALKAQAVISRTYALYQKMATSSRRYDITSSVLHQVYKGSTVDTRVGYAVLHTEGEVLYYNGRLIEAFYHSTCGGMTEDPAEIFGRSYPYLRPVESGCTVSPYSLWERKIPVEEMEKALNVRGIRELKVESYTSTKRVSSVKLTHEGGDLSVRANDLRKALGWSRLPSTNFEVVRENGAFIFDGKGYGHGVGLCQWSALEMAREGKTYREILNFFYPGTELRTYENR